MINMNTNKQEITGTEISVTSGDIAMEDADALITAINSDGIWYGGIDRAIMRVAEGQYHSQAAQHKLNDLDVVVARGDRNNHIGHFDNVIFVVDDLKSELHDVVFRGLHAADEAGFKVVTIPAIRTGVMLGVVERSLKEVVNEMVDGVKTYILYSTSSKQRNPQIKEIKFVIYNSPMLEDMLKRTLL
jgi:O-acetyl-ADP-ribose deacetylase (regulator of RNase III)